MTIVDECRQHLDRTCGLAFECCAFINRRYVRLGIVARLTIIFLGVAGLVVAGSFVLERSVLVERTTRTTFVAARAPAAAGPTAAASNLAAAPTAARNITAVPILLALDRFDGAVRERMGNNDEATEAAFQKSASRLNRAAADLLASNASSSNQLLDKGAAALRAHQLLGKSLILTAEARRDALLRYASLLDGLKMRDKSSIDKAWKIFGRVVTRQSLLQLGADLDGLAHYSAALDRADESADMTALLKAEAAVQADLDQNKDALVRSEGGSWYAAMHADVDALSAMRTALVRTNLELRGRMRDFSQQAVALNRLLPSAAESLADRPANSAGIKRNAAGSIPAPAPAAVPSLAAAAPIVDTHEVTTPLELGSSHDYLMWLCAVVVALLAYIAVGTAISIIRPVRRLVYAAELLAQGDSTARVPRGGIKELDSVAVAFNRMADEIAAARRSDLTYQESLEREVAERTHQLIDLAKHDPLTNLPNRRELFVLLNDAIARAQVQRERVAVFFLDIDNFKYINDSMGHAFGDRVLMGLARRLQDTTRAIGFCARLGGDEFTVVFERAPNDEAIREAGTTIVQAFHQPLTIDGRDLVVGVSVGASIYPDHETHSEGLLKAADAALFRSKAMGRCQLSVFTPDLLEVAAGKFTVEQGLRRALQRGEFELLFQPQICAATLKTTVVEALIRWRTPDGQLLAPSDFLAVAEESGLIMEMGDWVLRSAIEAAAHWHFGAWPDVCVAINVSPRQLIDAGFVDRVCELLQRHRLPTRCIEIELTESVLQTGPVTMDALRRLRAHGVAISLDDFGTGYSSLASLEQLPLTRIKLDRSLIAGIDQSSRAAAIANAIIGMCQGLGLDITAEGVERPEQFSMLVGERGMYLQGYLLARPAARDELIPLLNIVAQRARDLVLQSPGTGTAGVTDAAIPRLQLVSDTG